MNPKSFDPLQYKINTRLNWNTVAPNYHKNWANRGIGPFRSTIELLKAADIKTDDTILDLACGTGIVSKEASYYLDSNSNNNSAALIIGVDISRVALSIAKSSVNVSNAVFIEMDAENLGFRTSCFSKVLCQYSLMFFPNPNDVLKNIKTIMTKQGKLAIAVHGKSEEVPYFSCIMNAILKRVPDIRQKGTPSVHSLGNPNDLYNVILKAGFSDISIKKYTFNYQAGTFEDYWSDYLRSTANAIWTTVESKGIQIVSAIKEEAKQTATKFINNNQGIIQFPWGVLLATAYNI